MYRMKKVLIYSRPQFLTRYQRNAINDVCELRYEDMYKKKGSIPLDFLRN